MKAILLIALLASSFSSIAVADPQDGAPEVVIPATGGAPELATPVGGDVYVPVTGGAPIVGIGT